MIAIALQALKTLVQTIFERAVLAMQASPPACTGARATSMRSLPGGRVEARIERRSCS
jgi:hypothetical protein